MSQVAVAHQTFFFYDTVAMALADAPRLRVAALLAALPDPSDPAQPALDDLREAVATGEVAGIEQFWPRWRQCRGDEAEARRLLAELQKTWGFRRAEN